MNKLKLRINGEGKIKLFLSIALFLYSIIVTIITSNIGAMFSMLFSMIGDISIMASRGALTGKKENTFDVGIVAFAFAHMCYICARDNGDIITMAVALPIFITVFAITLFQPLGKKWNYIPYAVMIVLNVINAWQFNWLAGVGGILFIISDSILSIFEKKEPKYQIAIWITYVPAQILFLTSFLNI